MTIITAQPPYRDDFDKEKAYYRVLFKPGYPVQSRELTQQQTAIQHQIEKFGKHIFEEGSIVTGGQFDIDLNVPYVLLLPENGVGTPISLSEFVGKVIKGNVSGVSARILKVQEVTYNGTIYYPAFIRYVSGSETTENSTFTPGETATTVEVLSSTVKIKKESFTVPVLGSGSMFTIEEGVVFSKGLFIDFGRQSITLNAFSRTPTCRIGFNVVDDIVTATDDDTLLDIANGTPNYNAPGADRLKVTATLKKIEIDDTESLPNFVELFSIKDGVVQEKFNRPQYAVIGDEIAKRTNDESGDYCIRGMGIRIREHLDTGSNEGYLTLENGGDSDLLTIAVEPGLSYVKGYEINKLVTSYVSTPKSKEYKYINSQILSARSSNYILINEVVGTPVLDYGTVINLRYNGSPTDGEKRITNNTAYNAALSGVSIGTARIKSVVYESGVLGTASGRLRVYLYDIKITDATHNFTDVDSINCVSPYFFADIVKDSITNNTAIYQRFSYPLLYPIGTEYTRTIRSENDVSDTIFSFQRTTQNVEVQSSGKTSITLDTANEQFAYGSGNLSNNELKSILVTFTSAVETYKIGDMFDLSTIVTNDEDVVSIDSTRKTLSIDFKKTFDSTFNISITYNVSRSTAYEMKKELRSNRFVKLNCSSSSSLTSFNLGVSDVRRVVGIKKYSQNFPATNEDFDSTGVDVTDQFILNNGQTDELYDHASIRLRAGYTLTTNDRLVVKLDYFYCNYSQGVGYFSVDSYPINDSVVSATTIQTHEIPVYVSPDTGIKYNLRDFLDFRSIKVNKAADSSTVGGASENPVAATDLVIPTNGLRLPVPASQIFIDYSYYLARRDVVTLDKNGRFDVVKGVSAIYPVTPSIPETVMGVAKVFIPPYPSLSTSYARILDRTDIGCTYESITFERHTMRDIGVMKSRIKNLEYYTSMNLLEKQTSDMLILDKDGLDRFKNGFFIDPFVDHSLGDTTNDDYKISVDKIEKCIRPFYKMDSFLYDYQPVLSSNVRIGKSIITLPYIETVLLEQLKATSYRNIEQSVFRYIGTITMDPDTDIWVDTTTVDRTIQQDFSFDIADEFLGTEWGAWEDYLVGYNVYDRRVGDRSGNLNQRYYIGSYSSYKAAVAAGHKNDPAHSGRDRFLIETETTQMRTGTQLSYHDETSTQNLGTFVTDVSLATYIKPQIILIYSKGLKANTRFHVFFDNENMNNYTIPFVIPLNWNRDLNNPDLLNSMCIGCPRGYPLKTDAYGDLVFALVLPNGDKRFRIGTKEVKVTDSPTNAVDATSYAVGYFVAQGLIQQKQNTILSTKHTVVDTTTVTETRKKSTVEIHGPSCMAYSFLVMAPEGQDGVFLTSVDVWIQALHENLGVWFEIREMNSAGGITRTQVPYSEVWMYRNDPRLNVSTDGINNPTNVNFENPVFLQNDTQYAFVIHTEGLNPDTYFYVSRIGETDLETRQQVTARQKTGTVFTTNNNLNWDPVPDIDLKVRFNRAKFSIGSGTAVFVNKPNEFFTVKDRSEIFVTYGEEIRSSQILEVTVDPESTGVIEAGDTLSVSGESQKIATVLKVVGSNCYTDGYNFVENDVLVVTNDSPVAVKDVAATVSGITYGSAKLVSFNRRKDTMVLSGSNGLFFKDCVITGRLSGITATVSSIDDYPYSTIYYNPNTLVFTDTSITHLVREVVTSSDSLDAWQAIMPKTNLDFDTQRSLLSRTNEVDRQAGDWSAFANAILTTESEWVSPVVDMNRTSSIFIYNIVNQDITGETNPSGGNLWNKYISKVVTLAEGQDAEDLMVYLSAYVPNIANVLNYPIKVWAKIINNEDKDFFQNKSWIELEQIGDNLVYSSSINKQNYKELSFQFPRSMMFDNEINPGIQYDANGNTYTGFKQFAIKIGLLGNKDDTAIVPKVADLRVIALQM